MKSIAARLAPRPRTGGHEAAATLTFGAVAVALAGLAGVAGGLVGGLRAGLALLLYGGLAALVTAALARAGETAFALPNRLTLGRAALATLIAATAGMAPAPALAWAVVGAGSVALVLDAVDGRVARAQGLATEFGARFDREADAFLTLALALVVQPKAGAPALGIGLLHYLLLAAGVWLPRLRAPLRPSRRRQAIGVTQGVVLLVAMAPVVPAVMARILVAAAFLLLLASFAIDVWRLLRPPPPQGAGCGPLP
ncbi:MAG: CDP-alcohol phosphatidyltransferase family protein [Alphaproteobacteria bacterium]|nr:CDP-alcohol phosphatidyltransferase family protein [Alphaproteobacteria bacterium]